MRVFRLTRRKYANDLSGKGAAKFGNRWNSKGIEMLYTAESRALPMAEVVVHLSLASLSDDYVMIELEIPETVKVKALDLQQLDGDWNTNQPQKHTQIIGDKFITSKDYCILKVPSAVVKGDFNYLLNPNHEEIQNIRIVAISDFPFDDRIFN